MTTKNNRRSSAKNKQAAGDSPFLTTDELAAQFDNYLFDCEISGQSSETILSKRNCFNKVLWWAEYARAKEFNGDFCRGFFHYLATAHTTKNGRWNQSENTKPLSPNRRRLYRAYLRTFCAWLISEGIIDDSPMERIPSVRIPDEQVSPFTAAEVAALIKAAKQSRNAIRNEAMVRFMLDTGCRASEIIALRFEDVDLSARTAIVRGKGNKRRPIYFGKKTARCLWNWKKMVSNDCEGDVEDEPLFASVHGAGEGKHLTTSGLAQLVTRLGESAGLRRSKVSPHTFRHTFAENFIKNGGSEFALQRMLGHTTLTMTRKYVLLGAEDVAKSHRQFSPGDRYD